MHHVLAGFAFLLVASPHHSVVGKWVCSDSKVTTQLTLDAKGHYASMSKAGTTPLGGAMGTYALAGNAMSVHLTSREVWIKGFEKHQKIDLKFKSTLTWKDDKHFVISSGGHSATFAKS